MRSLHRTDWRFLLPPPRGRAFRHLVLLGGADALAESLGEAGIARRLSRRPTSDRSADAFVVLRGAQVSPEQAAASLAPGGGLYWELGRESGRGAAAEIASSLARLSLEPTGIYWVRPDLETAALYLPLDRPAAIDWYLGMVAGPRLRHAALRNLIRLLPGLLGLLVGGVALTAVAGPADGAVNLLEDPALPDEARGEEPRPLLLARSLGDPLRPVVIFSFARGERRPRAVLKLSRTKEENASTEKGQIVLETIRRSLDDSMRATLPRPLGILRFGEIAVASRVSCRDKGCRLGEAFSRADGGSRTCDGSPCGSRSFTGRPGPARTRGERSRSRRRLKSRSKTTNAASERRRRRSGCSLQRVGSPRVWAARPCPPSGRTATSRRATSSSTAIGSVWSTGRRRGGASPSRTSSITSWETCCGLRGTRPTA